MAWFHCFQVCESQWFPGFENVSPTVFAFPDHRATEKLTTCVDVGMNSRKLGVIMSSWIYNDVLFLV